MPSSIRMNSMSSFIPAIDAVRKNMKREFRKSMEKLQSEMSEYALYKDNYDFMMCSPIVQKLKGEIQLLDSKVDDLQYANRQLIRELKAMQKNEKRLNKKIKKIRRKKSVEETVVPDVSNARYPLVADNFLAEEHIVYELVEETDEIAVVAGEEDKEDFVVKEEEVVEEDTDIVEDEEIVKEKSEEEAEEEVVVEKSEEEAEEEVVVEKSEEEAEEEVVVEEAEEEVEEEFVVEEDEEESEEEDEEESEEEDEDEEEDEEVVEEDEEVVEEDEGEEEDEDEGEEEEVYEVKIKGKTYFTTNEQTGVIYAMDADGDVGDEVGKFVNGVATFTK